MSIRFMIAAPLAAGLSMLLALSSPAAAQVSRETWNDLQKQIRERKIDQAIQQVEALLVSNESTAADRVRLFQMGDQAVAALRPPRYDQAILWQQRIVDEAAFSHGARIDALARIADLQLLQLGGQDLHKMDLAPVYATLNQALTWQNLPPRDHATALLNIGKLHSREEAYDLAREHYSKALALTPDKRVQASIHELIAYSWAGQGDFIKARAIATEHGVDLIDLYRQFGMTQAQHDACIAVLDAADTSETERWNALRRLPAWHVYTRDYAIIRQVCDKYLAGFTASNEDRPRQVFMQVLRRLSADEQPDFILWAGPQVLASPRCTDAEYIQLKAMMVDTLAVKRQLQKLQAETEALRTDERHTPVNRLWFSLVADALATGTSRNIQKMLDAQTQLTAAQKSEALLMAGRTLLRGEKESLALGMHEAHLALLSVIEPASLVCEFVPQAPADISGWLLWVKEHKSLAAGKLDRPYGHNLQFLVDTDSANAGRTVATQTDQVSNDSRSDLHVLCDDKGLYIFLMAYDAQADEVTAGKVRGGGYEMYLAPGKQQAYYTLLASVDKGELDPQKFLTHYPTAQVHPLSLADHTFKSQTRQVPGGFATTMFMSWVSFYDKLPQENSRWQFEAIRWTRQGGFSFGGSKSVHNRSSWGDLIFQGLGEEQLLTIRKHIIHTAVLRYRESKKSTSPVGNWADPDLGDLHFHEQYIAPLLVRLDEAAATTGNEMTNQQVNALYMQFVPLWMDLEHHVASMRRDYLQEHLLNL